MTKQQLDLFSPRTPSPKASSSFQTSEPVRPPHSSEDAELIAGIARADVVTAPAMALEAGRRRLVGALPVLETLCLRFAGFDINRRIPEQEAALDALAMIGGQVPGLAQIIDDVAKNAVTSHLRNEHLASQT